TAPLGEDDVEEVAERMAPDEQRQGLVLVWRPLVELNEQESPDGRGGDGDPGEGEAPGELASGMTFEPADACRQRGFGHDASPYAVRVASDRAASLESRCPSTNSVARTVICSRFSTA